jgi:hypothetical protein
VTAIMDQLSQLHLACICSFPGWPPPILRVEPGLNPVRSHPLILRHLHRGTVIDQRGKCTPTCGDGNIKSLDLHLRTFLIRVETEGNDKRRGV